MTQPSFILFGKPEVDPVAKDVSDITISGNPQQNSWLYSDSEACSSKFGIWDCQAGVFQATMTDITEFCCIIEGEAEITNLDDGTTRTVKAGDAFVMEPGLRLEWKVEKYIKKYFAISSVNS